MFLRAVWSLSFRVYAIRSDMIFWFAHGEPSWWYFRRRKNTAFDPDATYRDVSFELLYMIPTSSISWHKASCRHRQSTRFRDPGAYPMINDNARFPLTTASQLISRMAFRPSRSSPYLRLAGVCLGGVGPLFAILAPYYTITSSQSECAAESSQIICDFDPGCRHFRMT
jgi:hypothetical protein